MTVKIEIYEKANSKKAGKHDLENSDTWSIVNIMTDKICCNSNVFIQCEGYT